MMGRVGYLAACAALALLPTAYAEDDDQKDVIPHAQSKPPGPALSPAEALKKFTVPEGFEVQLVASEPDLVNPVSMTFDERGRIWVTESFEYPRREAGEGRDRIKILEDTDHDGDVDSVKIFAEGLNIPSGIAVGHGGVWVANSPDLLFLQDTDGDDKADKKEVIVTGFGRTDTHELPNSLTWGPDGYLYGLNGVFNESHVVHNGKNFDFTCAMFRVHPKKKTFELFCEGTSNPWGIAFDNEGSAFVSACVIDHLWHLTESGYYHRQGGPYPPFTWKIESIVEHKHQMAAYCGIVHFDSAAYPEPYRNLLFMGNIHGNCINADRLERRGSTYFGTPEPDFLTADDAWFMPVAQKVGPDGCLYVLDWYDRYHCYQDANRDPDGIDRGKGRLYRVTYGKPGKVPAVDYSKKKSAELVGLLGDDNVYVRDTAQRLLVERNDASVLKQLSSLAAKKGPSSKASRHALWTLASLHAIDESLYLQLLNHEDSVIRSWAVRAAGNQASVPASVVKRIAALTTDKAPDVQLQVAIAANKLKGVDSVAILVDVVANAGSDSLLPHIVWQNLHPKLATEGERLLELVEKYDLEKSPALAELMPRITERMLAEEK